MLLGGVKVEKKTGGSFFSQKRQQGEREPALSLSPTFCSHTPPSPHPMRGTSVTPLADGLALLSLDGGPDGDAGGDLHWELSCSRLPAGAAGVARPRFSPAVRAASGAGASTSTWGEGEVAGAPSSRRPGDMRGGALFQVRQTAGEAFASPKPKRGCSANSRGGHGSRPCVPPWRNGPGHAATARPLCEQNQCARLMRRVGGRAGVRGDRQVPSSRPSVAGGRSRAGGPAAAP